MKLAIVGTRDFTDKDLFLREIEAIRSNHQIDTIISGGATGADSLAEIYAAENSIAIIIHRPEWSRYGRSAGPRRNALIVQDSDMMIAFWDGKSRGTLSSINLAKAKGIPLKIVRYV